MKTIRIAFKQFSDPGLRKKGEHIYDSLKENPIYVALAALLATVKVSLDKYSADLQRRLPTTATLWPRRTKAAENWQTF